MKIFLLGLTGAGKSTIGKLLAEKLGYPFIDLDDIIRFETRRSIEDIFETDGEDHFRKLESDYLRKVADIDRRVIATGGGTPCYHQGMDFIKMSGLSLFLYTPLDLVTSRLYNTKSTQRPLIKGKSKAELQNFLLQKFTERLPVYARADFSIDTNVGETPEKTAAILFELVKLIEHNSKMNPQIKSNQQ